MCPLAPSLSNQVLISVLKFVHHYAYSTDSCALRTKTVYRARTARAQQRTYLQPCGYRLPPLAAPSSTVFSAALIRVVLYLLLQGGADGVNSKAQNLCKYELFLCASSAAANEYRNK